jgi:hypothetical protein
LTNAQPRGIINLTKGKEIKEMKKFFGIEEKQYVFEWGDVSALLTVLNVFFIVMGMWWAPFFGLANCVLAIVGMIKAKAHLNAYIIQMALIVLNVFFLC